MQRRNQILCQPTKLTCMKKNINLVPLQLFAVICTLLFLSACSKDSSNKSRQTQRITLYTPIYKAKADVLAAINGTSSQSIEHAGKLYIKDNFIYLNEVNKGIHIIDNSNAAHPVQIAFLSIPGNLDIAIKGNTLYADMYTDLLALDITDPHNAKISSTLSNFFMGRAYVNNHPSALDDQVAVDWKEKDTTIYVDEYPYYSDNGGILETANAPGIKSNSGVAGSMAGMVLINNYLYAISEMHSLSIVDISNPAVPKLDSTFFAGFDLQTIYPFEDKLFLGSAIGMFMYDVSDPQHPASIGEFTHGRACDPVITDGSYAYVTLHAGESCGGDVNELNVIDVKDLQKSVLVKSYPLTKPTGLSKDGNLLFICDGTKVKIYNAYNPAKLVLEKEIDSNEPYDVIAYNNKALIVTADGLYQYDYSNINNVRLLSFLAAKK